MRVTKRQLRRIIREAGMRLTGKGWKDPAPGEPDSLWPRPGQAFDYNNADYAAGLKDGKARTPFLKGASDDYAAGYEDAIAAHWRDNPLQELGKGWQLSRGECDTHNISPNDAAEAIAVLQEFNYELGLPPAVDSNNIAINDALAAYPGEYSYEDFLCAIRVIQGRGV
jgi:hypothetical protein